MKKKKNLNLNQSICSFFKKIDPPINDTRSARVESSTHNLEFFSPSGRPSSNNVETPALRSQENLSQNSASKTHRVECEESHRDIPVSKAPRVEVEDIRAAVEETQGEEDEVQVGVEETEVMAELEDTLDMFEESSSLVRDPGLRKLIWEYPPSKQEEVRRDYLKFGPYQPTCPKNQSFPRDVNGRCFKSDWYTNFREWLEYSPIKNRAFCFPCFLFSKMSARQDDSGFVIKGFGSWKKVNGEKCALSAHVGKNPQSAHRVAVGCLHSFQNKMQHLETIIEQVTSEQVAKNRLRLMVTISSVKFCTFQGLSFRGHNEGRSSLNQGNIIEMVKVLGKYNKDVAATTLENAPQNAMYIAPNIQKTILGIFSHKIQDFIRKEIGDSVFCIMVDESRDESKREQMAIVLRFVDEKGFIQECFFDMVHVLDTKSATLKDEICKVLSRHDLSLQNIRGQGYDGANNMRGEWAGLQALISSECPYAYYIHCFAHRLQLALVAASKEVDEVGKFFSDLACVINIPNSSCKRHDQLRAAQLADIAEQLVINDEFETGTGKNQIKALKRHGDTRWGSHFGSISILISLFKATSSVISDVMNDGTTSSQRAEATGAYDIIHSCQFVFILHLMRELFEITDDLSQALQRKSQDILNAMHLVATTKQLVQKFRDGGWEGLFAKVNNFCQIHEIEIPIMDAPFSGRKGCSRLNKGLTNGHFYRVSIFIAAVDSQKQELNDRFKENVVELLSLSSSLDPRVGFRTFKIDDIYLLMDKFYSMDFNEQEKIHLRFQLQNYELDVFKRPEFKNLNSISELCQMMAKTGKSIIYPLVDRLIRLVMTLPVSTATTEHAFSAMKIVKTRLCNKMEDDFLSSYLITYIEKDIAEKFDLDSIVDAFDDFGPHRVQFKMPNFSK